MYTVLRWICAADGTIAHHSVGCHRWLSCRPWDNPDPVQNCPKMWDPDRCCLKLEMHRGLVSPGVVSFSHWVRMANGSSSTKLKSVLGYLHPQPCNHETHTFGNGPCSLPAQTPKVDTNRVCVKTSVPFFCATQNRTQLTHAIQTVANLTHPHSK